MAVTGGPPWVSRPSVGGARPNASLRRVAANYHGIRLTVGAAPYGVRSAVTSRASLIAVFLPATRRQEASKFGQAFCEQLGPTVLMSSRSALPRACGTLASTCGANPGRTVRAAAIHAAMAIAERALIMTVPCHGPLWPVVSLVNGVRSARFRISSPNADNGFFPPEFCVVAHAGRNTAGLHRRRVDPTSSSGTCEIQKTAGQPPRAVN